MARIKPGSKKRGGRKKGVKNRATVEKAILESDLWDSLKGYATGDGAAKCIRELKRLKGASFLKYYGMFIEYFKPKLSRTEHTGEGGGPMQMQVITADEETKAELEKLKGLAGGK